MSNTRLYAEPWGDYELIDAGGGKKLERWGKVITIRPELQAYFKSERPFSKWYEIAHWEFVSKNANTGNWRSINKAPDHWELKFKSLKFNLHLTKFKHVGLFPEQSINWEFINNQIQPDDPFLNLFAYTGAASCVAKNKGADVYHVDSVKQLISWAKENMESSRLLNIRWVLEDALKFSKREVKRGKKYRGIVMDPPAWGVGAKNEKWKLEDKLDELLGNARRLLDKDGFLILNTYSPTIDIATLNQIAELYFMDMNYIVSELWMKTTTGKELYYGNLLRVSPHL